MAPGVTNLMAVTEFMLLGFPTQGTMGFLHPLLFSLVYLCALLGNGLIVLITTLDRHLYTPKYFFLRSLSFLDLCLISAMVPKSIASSLRHNSSISFLGCVLQDFVLVISATVELHLLMWPVSEGFETEKWDTKFRVWDPHDGGAQGRHGTPTLLRFSRTPHSVP